MTPPRYDEVRCSIRKPHDEQCRQGFGLIEKQVIHWQHHLRGVKPELNAGLFELVDGGAVHIGLARFAQAAVTGGDPESFEQRLQ